MKLIKNAEAIQEYVEGMTTPETDILYNLKRETYLKVLSPQMISGHYQGRLLTMITQMIRPKRVLEVGTFTGYTAICFGMGLPEDGQVHTIEINEERENIIRKHLEKAELEEKVILYIGDAKEIIPTIDEMFDLVFIDASKMEYDTYFDLIFEKVREGGFILTDNVLWYGKVLEEKKDKKTAAIHAFNSRIQEDERVENILLPMMDGIMIARKI
ncbi:MAG: O-methyltransferase [Saprospiraceae bacterium]